MKIELKLAKVVSAPWSCIEGEDPKASLKIIGTFTHRCFIHITLIIYIECRTSRNYYTLLSTGSAILGCSFVCKIYFWMSDKLNDTI